MAAAQSPGTPADRSGVPPRQDLRPFLGTPVTLWEGDDDTVRRRFVLDASLQRTAVLRPADDTSRAWAMKLKGGEKVTLGAGDVDGFVTANLVVDRWSGPQRMLLVSVPAKPVFLQRRSVFRVAIQVPVEVLSWGSGMPQRTVGVTKDMSIDGLSAALVVPPTEHLEAVVLLKLPTKPVVVGGKILEHGEKGVAAARLHLHLIGAAERRELSAFLRRAEIDRARLTRVRTA